MLPSLDADDVVRGPVRLGPVEDAGELNVKNSGPYLWENSFFPKKMEHGTLPSSSAFFILRNKAWTREAAPRRQLWSFEAPSSHR